MPRIYTHKCECVDRGCGEHAGKAKCNSTRRTARIYRIDMTDNTGTRMCPGCQTDALASGVFATERAS